ncbi:MAG: asparagine synthase (glutamine-hydrolyzing) [Bacteroidota bacterium]
MCGITGVISRESKDVSREIKVMNDALEHRGPDASGVWSNREKTVHFGHRRLSIIDLSETANQPLHYQENNYTIVFNGEIYNYIELKKELVKKGYLFRSSSDTEVLLALYADRGLEFIKDLDGMFAFAIWDGIQRKVICARDRFGEKPFYFSHRNNQLVFASEMKALFALGIQKRFKENSIFDYLVFNSLQDDFNPGNTVYEGVYTLKPSEMMVIDEDHNIDKWSYWSCQSEDSSLGKSAANIKEEFRFLFFDSIQKRLRSDVLVGSSLSGGLDSSSIVAGINNLNKEQLKQRTFSAKFPGFERNEGPQIDSFLGGFSNIDSFFVYPDANSIQENFERICHYQDEPFGSFSICAQYEVMKLAKENETKVLLDGQGADELLGGYVRFYITYLMQIRKNASLFAKEHAFFDERNINNFEFSLKNKLKYSFPYSSGELANYFRRTKKNDHSIFKGLNPELVKENKNRKPKTKRFKALKGHLSHALLHKDLGQLLKYADRNSMANSIEVRLPFLSHKLVEFVLSLPESYFIKDGWTKYILRDSMSEYLPKSIAWNRQKIGFEPPNNEILNAVFFKERIQDSISKLKKERIIVQDYPELNWKYLMLAQYT